VSCLALTSEIPMRSDSNVCECDICIIGSGASGGISALVLAQSGFKVLLLEAGPPLDIQRDYKQHLSTYDFPDRGIDVKGIGETPMANGFWKIKGEPYINAPGTDFRWFRSRIVGGRTNHWGRGVARFSAEDFKGRSLTGAGEDWPLSYEDLAPFYSKVEEYIGVVGPTTYFAPATSDMPMPPPKCYEMFIKGACDQLGLQCLPTGSAVITRTHNGRPACHYCAQCYRGCKVAAGFSVAQTAFPDALRTGRLQLLTNAMARELLVDSRGLVRAVSYVDKLNHCERRISTRCVILAASSCESARLLLNSRSSQFPEGLCNSSKVVGRYLKDSVGTRIHAYFPHLERSQAHNCDGIGRPHIMLPWWHPSGCKFSKGYEILFLGGRHMPLMGMFDAVSDEVEGFGLELKRTCRERYGAYLHFVITGEMQSNEESYCEIDPALADTWGIPVLRFHFAWGKEEIDMARHMLNTTQEIIETAGGIYLGPNTDLPTSMTFPGENFHEVGTVRMGDNREIAALNSFCQSYDTPNLFVVDGGCFVTCPEKPPTLTIMALAWRAADYIIQQTRRGECGGW
jgi:choline dehydrogenase-like flavoprotein